MSDVEEEASALLINPAMWLAIADAKKSSPGMFVSGWEEDREGVEENSDDDMETDDREKMILKAAEHGDYESVKRLLDEDSSLVRTRDSDEYTPMHRASYNNHPQVIELLLENGAEIQARTEHGWTPLHCAACWGCFDAALTLVNAGADINALTDGKLTPLHLAAACTEDPEGGAKTVHLLLGNDKIDLTVKSGAGETATEIGKRHSKVVMTLLTMTKDELEAVDVHELWKSCHSTDTRERKAPGNEASSTSSM